MSSVTRIAQHRMTQHLRCNNIIFGSAIVVSAKKENVEGWVLPGGKFTRNRTEAFKICRKIKNRNVKKIQNRTRKIKKRL